MWVRLEELLYKTHMSKKFRSDLFIFEDRDDFGSFKLVNQWFCTGDRGTLAVSPLAEGEVLLAASRWKRGMLTPYNLRTPS